MTRSYILTLALALLLALGLAAPAGAQSPSLTVTAPADGATIQGASVTISFQTSGIKLVKTTVPLSEAGKHPEVNRAGEGHLHFALDLQPLVVWEKSDPYTFSNLPPGDHQLMVELANNDHSSLSPRVMRQINFKTAMPLPATGLGAAQPSNRPLGPALLLATLAVFAICAGLRARRAEDSKSV
jgi:hypothetical protein